MAFKTKSQENPEQMVTQGFTCDLVFIIEISRNIEKYHRDYNYYMI